MKSRGDYTGNHRQLIQKVVPTKPAKRMSNLSDFRWGLTGGLIAVPLGLALGGLATKLPWLTAFMGTEWFVYKACVSACVISGFGIGLSLHKHSRGRQAPAEAAKEADF